MERDFRNIELRFVIKTDMLDRQLDNFTKEVKQELKDIHLVEQEEVLTSLYTEKISYESRQQIKELEAHGT